MSTDHDWEEFGRTDPYHGVLTAERFRRKNMDDAARQEFFDSGREHVAKVVDVVRTRLDAGFSPRRVLDFGCGVGRLVIPFTELGSEVVGVDVSESMLSEARQNCSAQGIGNATFVLSDDDLSRVDGKFDFIHSYIVFQHIPRDRGTMIFRKLLERLTDGGVGCLHVTYDTTDVRGGIPDAPVQRDRSWKAVLGPMRAPLARLKQKLFSRPAAPAGPIMEMNAYSLREVFAAVQGIGVASQFVEFTNHAGELGVILYFQKPVSA
ncbi:class I SAM-dependent methyltransferase [Longimicrobium sp.]|jgi:2-polyprenyl-3-methyl-5-hydroxy-6-metoxy-1,4-benzoquinol methylase|uniref:class I SAM-dependent methyltransferase n=1 Tax=Longimicrobium sp. TaxID=2029185 RepID=UPI002ED8CC2A